MKIPTLTVPRLASLIAFLGLLAMAVRPSVDSDSFWHLRAGEWMLANGGLLSFDIFSHTRFDYMWINHSWLAEILMAAAFRAFGFAGLNLATAVVICLTFLCVYAAGEGGPYLRAFAIVLAAVTSAVYWSARPQIVSLLLAAVFNLILIRFRRGQSNHLWLLPIFTVLWVNLHGGWALGFILLTVTLIGQVIESAVDRFRSPQPLRWLAATVALCLVAVVINPYGPGLLLYPFHTVSIGALQNYILEWQSPNFHLRESQVFIVLWLGTFAAVGFARLRLTFTDFLLFGVFTGMALLALRNVAAFAVVAAPILMRYGDSAIGQLQEHWPRLRLGSASASPSRPASLLNWVLLSLVAAAVGMRLLLALSPANTERDIARISPVGAAEYLKTAPTTGNLFNSYNYGGYLVWALYPKMRVFVDGRTDLYGDQLLTEYLNAYLAGPGWEQTLARYNIGVVLVEPGAPLARVLAADPQWAIRFSDARAVVIVRLP